MKIKFLLTIGLGALVLTGCPDSNTTNVNTNGRTNLGTNNANNIYVVNNNSNIGANGNANLWNDNDITRDEYDRNRAEYERDRRTGETIGTGANDGWLWTKTRAALLTTNDLRESTIDVDVENEVVTLDGTVATAAQKTKAEQVAKGIEGVKNVRNNLKVTPDDADDTNNSNRNANANTNRR